MYFRLAPYLQIESSCHTSILMVNCQSIMKMSNSDVYDAVVRVSGKQDIRNYFSNRARGISIANQRCA